MEEREKLSGRRAELRLVAVNEERDDDQDDGKRRRSRATCVANPSSKTTCLPIAPNPMRVSTRSAAQVKLSASDSPPQLARTESSASGRLRLERAGADEFSVVCQSLPRTDP
jgi:hypothetical protein